MIDRYRIQLSRHDHGWEEVLSSVRIESHQQGCGVVLKYGIEVLFLNQIKCHSCWAISRQGVNTKPQVHKCTSLAVARTSAPSRINKSRGKQLLHLTTPHHHSLHTTHTLDTAHTPHPQSRLIHIQDA